MNRGSLLVSRPVLFKQGVTPNLTADFSKSKMDRKSAVMLPKNSKCTLTVSNNAFVGLSYLVGPPSTSKLPWRRPGTPQSLQMSDFRVGFSARLVHFPGDGVGNRHGLAIWGEIARRPAGRAKTAAQADPKRKEIPEKLRLSRQNTLPRPTCTLINTGVDRNRAQPLTGQLLRY